MKKFIAGLSALALAGMMTMTAFADTTVQPDPEKMPNPKPASAGTEVSYNVSPTYTVVIPASAQLSDAAETTSDITATDVKLEEGSKIVVTLDKAENAKGEEAAGTTTFSATNASGNSVASYTIKAGETDVAVGGTVVEFSTKTGTETKTLTFSKATGATYAGKHTEQLTFGIKVEAASAEKQFTLGNVTFTYHDGDTWRTIAGNNDNLAIYYDSLSGKDVIRANGGSSWLCKGSIGRSHTVDVDSEFDPTVTDYLWW